MTASRFSVGYSIAVTRFMSQSIAVTRFMSQTIHCIGIIKMSGSPRSEEAAAGLLNLNANGVVDSAKEEATQTLVADYKIKLQPFVKAAPQTKEQRNQLLIYLTELEKIELNPSILSNTLIGKTVKACAAKEPYVLNKARQLLWKWKNIRGGASKSSTPLETGVGNTATASTAPDKKDDDKDIPATASAAPDKKDDDKDIPATAFTAPDKNNDDKDGCGSENTAKQPPTASPAHRQYFYIDLSKKEQGPFDESMMIEWTRLGMFLPSQIVKLSGTTNYVQIHEVQEIMQGVANNNTKGSTDGALKRVQIKRRVESSACRKIEISWVLAGNGPLIQTS
jgi:GYF domain/TFIIS helical bundle-like domain